MRLDDTAEDCVPVKTLAGFRIEGRCNVFGAEEEGIGGLASRLGGKRVRKALILPELLRHGGGIHKVSGVKPLRRLDPPLFLPPGIRQPRVLAPADSHSSFSSTLRLYRLDREGIIRCTH